MFYPYSYQKATPENPHPGKIIPPYLKLLPTIFSAIGLGLIGSVLWPIISYQIIPSFPNHRSSTDGLISPLVDDSFDILASQDQGPQVLSDIDFTKASNWFTNAPIIEKPPLPSVAPSTINTTSPPADLEFFSLAIPSLGIKSASVKVNGEDLSKSLIHYPGTALPGETGSVVIFGHSTLPQFYKPDNYTSIFSTLPNTQIGADIFTTVDKVTYTYRVTKIYQVKPQDTWALRQVYDQRLIKLVTCVPPGTTLRRLIVEAQLIENQ
jgi:LPXTG-site transpeptidase (sortase) family protein